MGFFFSSTPDAKKTAKTTNTKVVFAVLSCVGRSERSEELRKII